MRKIIAEITVSLDGFIEGPCGELDWASSVVIAGKEATFANEFLSRFDTIFFGRIAYEKFGFPHVQIDQCELEREFYQTINTMRKYVFSRTERHVKGNGMVINHNLEEEVNRIREEDGKDIWLCGGASIIQTFVALELIDEFILIVPPTAIGYGKSLFGNISHLLNFQLLRTEQLNSGVMILSYQPERLAKIIYDRSV